MFPASMLYNILDKRRISGIPKLMGLIIPKLINLILFDKHFFSSFLKKYIHVDYDFSSQGLYKISLCNERFLSPSARKSLKAQLSQKHNAEYSQSLSEVHKQQVSISDDSMIYTRIKALQE